MRVRLEEIASFFKGTQINGDELSPEFPYPFLNGGVNPSGNWKEANCPADTITVSEGGNSCGYVNFMENPFWCGAHCYFLTDVKGFVKYVYYALKSQQSRLMAQRSGACMPNIKKRDLGTFEFEYCTNISDQKRIAAILDKICEMKRNAEARLQKLDLLVKARFVEMFGDPIMNPKQWPVTQLGKHINVLAGYPFDSSKYVSTGIKICGGLIIAPNGINWNECKYWPSIDGYEEYVLCAKDIVMALDRPWISTGFKVAMISDRDVPALLIQRTARIRGVDFEQEFILSLLRDKAFEKHCTVTGSLVPHISHKDIQRYEVITPPLALQQQFAAFVEKVEGLKATAKKELEQVDLLYRAKLQEYFG